MDLHLDNSEHRSKPMLEYPSLQEPSSADPLTRRLTYAACAFISAALLWQIAIAVLGRRADFASLSIPYVAIGLGSLVSICLVAALMDRKTVPLAWAALVMALIYWLTVLWIVILKIIRNLRAVDWFIFP